MMRGAADTRTPTSTADSGAVALTPSVRSVLERTLFGHFTGLSFLSAVERSQESVYRELLTAALMGEEPTLEEIAAAMARLPDEKHPSVVQLRHYLRVLCSLGAEVCDKLEESGLGGAAGHLEPEPAYLLVNETLHHHFGATSIDELEEVRDEAAFMPASDSIDLTGLQVFDDEALTPAERPWSKAPPAGLSTPSLQPPPGRPGDEEAFEAPSENSPTAMSNGQDALQGSGSTDMRGRAQHRASDWLEAVPDTGPDPWLGLEFAEDFDDTPSEDDAFLTANPVQNPASTRLEPSPSLRGGLPDVQAPAPARPVSPPMAPGDATAESHDPLMSALHDMLMAEPTETEVLREPAESAPALHAQTTPLPDPLASPSSGESTLSRAEAQAAPTRADLPLESASLPLSFPDRGVASHSGKATSRQDIVVTPTEVQAMPPVEATAPSPTPVTQTPAPEAPVAAPPSKPQKSGSWIELVEEPLDHELLPTPEASLAVMPQVIELSVAASLQLTRYMTRGHGNSGSNAGIHAGVKAISSGGAPAPALIPMSVAPIAPSEGRTAPPTTSGSALASAAPSASLPPDAAPAPPSLPATPPPPPSFLLTMLDELGALDEPDLIAWCEFMRGPVFHADHDQATGVKGMRVLLDFLQSNAAELRRMKERNATAEARLIKLQRLEEEQAQHDAQQAQVDETFQQTERLIEQLFYAEPIAWSDLTEEQFPARPAILQNLARIGETLESWRMGYEELTRTREESNQELEDYKELVKDKERLISHVERQLLEREERYAELQKQGERKGAELAQLKVLSLYNHVRYLILSLKTRIETSIAPKGLLGRRSLPPPELMKLFVQDMDQIEKIVLRLSERMEASELKVFADDLEYNRKYSAAFRKRIGGAVNGAAAANNGKAAANGSSALASKSTANGVKVKEGNSTNSHSEPAHSAAASGVSKATDAHGAADKTGASTGDASAHAATDAHGGAGTGEHPTPTPSSGSNDATATGSGAEASAGASGTGHAASHP